MSSSAFANLTEIQTLQTLLFAFAAWSICRSDDTPGAATRGSGGKVADRAIASDDENRVARLRPPARRDARITLRLDLLRCRTGRPLAAPVRSSRFLAIVPRDRAAAPR